MPVLAEHGKGMLPMATDTKPSESQEKLLAAAVKAFEKHFTVYPQQGTSRLAPTGEPFVTVDTGGIRAEGERLHAAATPADAIGGWITNARKLIPTGDIASCTLYWRDRPSLGQLSYGGWTVYARLLISNKPVTQNT